MVGSTDGLLPVEQRLRRVHVCGDLVGVEVIGVVVRRQPILEFIVPGMGQVFDGSKSVPEPPTRLDTCALYCGVMDEESPSRLLLAGDVHGNARWIGTLCKLAHRHGCDAIL